MKISLDSNVFRDQNFIEWLILNTPEITVYMSIITTLETYYWYVIRGLSKSEFQEDISALHAQIVPFVSDHICPISTNAKNSRLRFKHHARDFIIGTHAQLKESILITHNLKHFPWINADHMMTPDDFVLKFSTDK